MMIYTTGNKTSEGVEDHSSAFYFLRNMSLDIDINLHTHLLSFLHSLALPHYYSIAPPLGRSVRWEVACSVLHCRRDASVRSGKRGGTEQ